MWLHKVIWARLLELFTFPISLLLLLLLVICNLHNRHILQDMLNGEYVSVNSTWILLINESTTTPPPPPPLLLLPTPDGFEDTFTCWLLLVPVFVGLLVVGVLLLLLIVLLLVVVVVLLLLLLPFCEAAATFDHSTPFVTEDVEFRLLLDWYLGSVWLGTA